MARELKVSFLPWECYFVLAILKIYVTQKILHDVMIHLNDSYRYISQNLYKASCVGSWISGCFIDQYQMCTCISVTVHIYCV